MVNCRARGGKDSNLARNRRDSSPISAMMVPFLLFFLKINRIESERADDRRHHHHLVVGWVVVAVVLVVAVVVAVDQVRIRKDSSVQMQPAGRVVVDVVRTYKDGGDWVVGVEHRVVHHSRDVPQTEVAEPWVSTQWLPLLLLDACLEDDDLHDAQDDVGDDGFGILRRRRHHHREALLFLRQHCDDGGDDDSSRAVLLRP
mmetsp:Transcript_20887/g.57773  ORF Transcript_20887/g.57773 Transcript_20887/m.57773 type:complete len:201 (+) Transcript_20887:1220-1822(+)